MTKLQHAFQNQKLFIPYVCCGDPDLQTTKEIVQALADEGAGIIELGIPFSDPTAEGPVIMEASERALKAGCTTDKVFDLIEDLRQSVDTPFVIMTYANVVYGYGTDRFLERAAAAGVNGLILPDVPFEEKDEFAIPCKTYGLSLISLIAPTSEERIETIASQAEGFLYIVSSLGVTGTRSEISTDLDAIVAKVRSVSDIPCAIGFGISTPEQARSMAALSDGAIVGSAISKLVATHGKDAVDPVRLYARQMVQAAAGL